jgi:hypothetical protein
MTGYSQNPELYEVVAFVSNVDHISRFGKKRYRISGRFFSISLEEKGKKEK